MIQPSSNGSRVSYGKIPEMLPVADLIETQIRPFSWFKREGLRELFEEINPITDYTGKNYELKFLDYEFGQPKFDKEECRNRDMTFAAPLRINTRLTIRTGENAGEIKESEVFMGDFPIMTEEGTFIVNGTERVVVSQLVRSPGIYFTSGEDRASGRMLYAAKLIPNRGAWLEIETSGKDVLTVKIDRKRKIPVTTLVRALGYGSNNEIKSLFADPDAEAKAWCRKHNVTPINHLVVVKESIAQSNPAAREPPAGQGCPGDRGCPWHRLRDRPAVRG